MSSIGATARRRGRAAPTFSLATFLPYRLSVVAAEVSEGLAVQYGARFGLTIAEWRVLATVGACDGITASDIAAHAHLGKVKVSRAAASLSGRGLLSRRPDEEDGRQAHLSLTPEGRIMHGEVVRLALDYVGRLTENLSGSEQAALHQVIDTLTLRARDMAAAGKGAP